MRRRRKGGDGAGAFGPAGVRSGVRVAVLQPGDAGATGGYGFVAGVPEKAPVSTVVTAKEALKPELVRSREHGKRGKRQKRLRRKTPSLTANRTLTMRLRCVVASTGRA